MTAAPGWRAVLAGLGIKVHPAADRFRLLEGQALQDLAADIERHGLRHPPVLWRAKDGDPWHLADGRNRCSAMALLVEGDVQIEGAICLADRREGGDLNALIRSLNVERRHLSAKEKDDRIAELLVADPTRSDRQIATETGYHKNKVGRVRSGLEDVGTIAHVSRRTDSVGRQQPATKPPVSAKPASPAPRPAASSPPKAPRFGPRPSPALQRDTLICDVCGWLRADLRGALESLLLILRDERFRIAAEIPEQTRLRTALGLLQTLGVTADQLKGVA